MDLEKFIKRRPADFIVEEVLPFKPQEKGKYKLYELKKSNLSTLQVVRFIASLLKIKPSEIGFAGLKDKIAVTTQYITLPESVNFLENISYLYHGGRWIKADKINFENQTGFSMKFTGFTQTPLSLGDNLGNRFIIKIDNIDKDRRKVFYSNLEVVKKFGCANYFGEQRFGSVKGRNDFIFLYLLKGNIEKAMKIYFSIKGNIKNWGKWEALYRDLKGKLEQYERDLILGLKRGLPPEKAVRILPKNIRLMFNFAFQSYMWNEYLRKYIEAKYPFKRVSFIHNWKLSFYTEVYDIEYLKNLQIPYTGKEFLIEDKTLKEIIKRTLEEHSITEDLFDKELIGIKVLTDGLRNAVFFPEEFKIVQKTKNTITVKFFLPAGSYATILLRNLLF
ncbi:tRNA pseudouridine13 synthase [Persephonella hydrogeniphila]|uniref:tRNA pseudouridine synthase D n=1 Tax=Persephonella hydrogeniphila TaxID=198703 RepID=A0A285NNK8_9AQUI|nr:tRNA pseudouridine(13) synthase TruD [Persephonella hydrogeniphila]SNZ11045.1 tRNA pseudouridine13 synthase [Persephonella hydrogeniphila]